MGALVTFDGVFGVNQARPTELGAQERVKKLVEVVGMDDANAFAPEQTKQTPHQADLNARLAMHHVKRNLQTPNFVFERATLIKGAHEGFKFPAIEMAREGESIG